MLNFTESVISLVDHKALVFIYFYGVYMFNIIAYIMFARLNFQRNYSYKMANFSGLFTNIFFLVLRVSVFKAIYPPGIIINDLTINDTLSYTCLTQSILMVVPQWGFFGVDDDIRTGQIIIHLSRPINYYCSTIAQHLGRSAFFLVFRTFPILLFSALFGFLLPPASLEHIFLFFATMFFASWIAISIHFISELSAFWLDTSKGVKIITVGLIEFFSGLIFPITFFPETVKYFSKFLPFEYTLNAPSLIYLGKDHNLLYTISMQIVWIIVLSLICIVLLSIGERKVVLHGG